MKSIVCSLVGCAALFGCAARTPPPVPFAGVCYVDEGPDLLCGGASQLVLACDQAWVERCRGLGRFEGCIADTCGALWPRR